MSVTDTKEFMRMETAADKLGVDPVKLVRMMQDKKMMIRLELPAHRFEEVKWEIHGKKMIENEPVLHSQTPVSSDHFKVMMKMYRRTCFPYDLPESVDLFHNPVNVLFRSFLFPSSQRKDEGSCHKVMIQRYVYILLGIHTFVREPQYALLFPEPPPLTICSMQHQGTVPGYS